MCPHSTVNKTSRDPLSTLWRPWECEFHNAPIREEIKCRFCDATFRRESELRRHHSSVHLRKCVLCHVCQKVFTRKDNLTRHHKLAHGIESKPRCRFCSKSLSRKDAVQRHESTCLKKPCKTQSSMAEEYPTHIQRLQQKFEKSCSIPDASHPTA